jgi:hypothetical protein
MAMAPIAWSQDVPTGRPESGNVLWASAQDTTSPAAPAPTSQATPSTDAAPTLPSTKAGLRLGVSTGYTHYREPEMQLAGPNLGLQLEWAQPLGQAHWVLQAYGLLSAPNYSSPVSGTIDRRTTRETVWRALYSSSEPATALQGRWEGGLELQTYYNDLRGTTTASHVGYERERYGLWALLAYKAPVAHAQALGAQRWRLEAAVLLQGVAVSYLSQVSASYSDAVNRQNRGLSLRAERSYRYAAGEFTPYLSVSWVGDSDVQRQTNYTVMEPANTTWQLGVKWFWD